MAARLIEIAQSFEGAFGFAQRRAGAHRLILIACHSEAAGFQLTVRQGTVRFGTRQRTIGIPHGPVGRAAGIARGLISPRQFRQTGGEHFVRLAHAVGFGGRVVEVFFQPFQAIKLLQPQCRRRWCVLSGRAKTVPAPQIALDADQPLARFKAILQARTVARINQPDLPHPAHQNVRNGHVVGQGFDAFGQRLRLGVGGQRHPARSHVGCDCRGLEVIGKRRAKGLFVAGLDPQLVKNLGAFGAVAVHQFGQCAGFSTQGVCFAFGL